MFLFTLLKQGLAERIKLGKFLFKADARDKSSLSLEPDQILVTYKFLNGFPDSDTAQFIGLA